MPPTAERLREIFDYDPDSGVLSRKRTTRRNTKARAVGTTTYYGYLQITHDGKPLLVHRLIWCWMTGDWPHGQIDHRDRNRSNNRWGNLRDVTPSINRQNSGAPCGYPPGGLHRDRRRCAEIGSRNTLGGT